MLILCRPYVYSYDCTTLLCVLCVVCCALRAACCVLRAVRDVRDVCDVCALLVDVARHDADLALARLDDARAVRPDEARHALLRQRVLHPHHVLLRDPLRDAHHQRHLRLERLQDRSGRERRRDVDDRRVRAGALLRLRV